MFALAGAMQSSASPPIPTRDVFIEQVDVDTVNDGDEYSIVNSLPSVGAGFIRRTGPIDKASGGPTGSTGNTGPHLAHSGLRIIDEDTVEVMKGASGARKNMFEIWRYTGAASGPNEFIVRDRFEITIPANSGFQTQTLASSGISNLNKCIAFHNGLTATVTSNSEYEKTTIGVRIDGDNNQIVCSRNNLGTLVAVTVYVTVVEFTGSNWTVGYATSSNHDTTDELGINIQDGNGASPSTLDISDWGTAMIIEGSHEGDTAEAGLSDVLGCWEPGASTTQIDFINHQDGNARNDGEAYAYILQNDDMLVDRGSNNNLTEGNGSYGTNISFPAGADDTRDMDAYALEWFVDTTGVGNAHARGRLQGQIYDNAGTPVIRHWVHRQGNNVRVRYGVVDVSQITS